MVLLTVGNPKTAKGEKLGYLTAILHFAPAELSGRNVCAHSTAGCRAACLNTAGRGGIQSGIDKDGMIDLFGPPLNVIQRARIARTRMFTADKHAFMVQLATEIAAHERRAIRHGLKCAVRLNGTSDLPWENVKCGGHANIFAMFPAVTFYDYTKFPVRLRRKVAAIPNYTLTFSRSGENDEQVLEALAAGVNVAAVFSTRKGQPLPAMHQTGPLIVPVIDGDVSDLRFTDPQRTIGVIVGLRSKGRAKKMHDPFIIEA